ncbi:MAG: homocysteine S-methyltransferase family protein [Gammaproteobacteria bacterium]|nr:homocysteine S-methyltransferase family protein [Gammaproteobacteria bacterium]
MFALEDKLKAGDVIVVDGATGTELQRRGAPMDRAAWCARATLTHPGLLRQLHEDYIRAGAHVVTANTFASSRRMLAPAGLDDAVAEINTNAVRIVREARDRTAPPHPVAVAGSLSTMKPILPGTGKSDPAFVPTAREAKATYGELADLLAEAGAEMILMEMMCDVEQAGYALEAAVATGLPVWVGFSVHATVNGRVTMHGNDELDFAQVIDPVMRIGGSVAGVMHSCADETTAALEILFRHWSGPVSAYPESGYFEMPEWRFVDIVAPEAFAAQTRSWVESGVQIVGGCCGIGPEHIEAMTARLPRRMDHTTRS